MPPDDAGRAWVEYPPSWALPVSVPCNITLVRRHDLFVWAGAVCAYPAGFLFYLVAGFDIRGVTFAELDFRGRERLTHPSPARLQVRFSDGMTAGSDTAADRRLPRGPVLVADIASPKPSMAGDGSYRRHESRWWVSPLPPPGPLEFTVYLRDFTEPAGVGRVDAGLILTAASRSGTYRPRGEDGLWNYSTLPMSRRLARSPLPYLVTWFWWSSPGCWYGPARLPSHR